ncbi:pentatricopeptide repeat-containing protein At4g30700 [Magnolia sinica]|uniref:pentatricopeptide repeat-containing protein At4g30700 n=1 Tax=Magnolia sinica TaxID=86752 RepID=UPI0026592195|nr:pentatricopeptide repeat-containing protein At4g30700 [Magnolia sinica]
MRRQNLTTLISNSTTLSHLNQILAHLILTNLQSNLSLVTKFSQKLSDLGNVTQSHLLFSSIHRPDRFLFNVLIRSFSQNNLPSSAISLYGQLLQNPHLQPDNFTFAFAIAASSSLNSNRAGRLLHAHTIVSGYGPDRFVASTVADFYLRFSDIDNACKVFDRIPDRDTVCWNTVISGLVWNGCFVESVRVFERMVGSGAQFDSTTLAAVLPALAELQELKVGAKVHCLAMKRGMDSNDFVSTGLISMYSKCGEVSMARLLFGQIDEPDLIAWNAMISGYSCNGDVKSAMSLFKALMIDGGKANSSTVVGLIPVFSPFGHMGLSQSIHGFSIKAGIYLNSAVSTALATVYARLNDMESARQLFDEMPEKSLASWNAMISGYAQNGFTDMAISLFRRMQMGEVRPNPITVTSILSACAQLGALSLGKWIHELIIKERIDSNVYVSTALIDMYVKCGSIGEARHLFNGMSEKNVVSWNAMISGYGLHGQGPEALKLFAEMLNVGVVPTAVTFLSVLYACSHAGLVTNGCEIFESMTHEHGIMPGSEHYACMVDLLGRAGQLEKALEFIKTMPVEPGPGVWGALLGACMIHKNASLARIASERLFELEPENTGYYVLLSNIYSSDRNYPQAAIVRQLAQRRKLAKTPGCTLIEVGDTLHVFTATDRSHPQSDEIYAMLEKLIGKMTEAGFRAETDVALYDVEEEEKEQMVKVHSEKLAIAFGLISTEPGTEIRIIKNLRVCLDCHNATKFISKITERVIVVRDANRFHHFRDGVCSCGDYW